MSNLVTSISSDLILLHLYIMFWIVLVIKQFSINRDKECVLPLHKQYSLILLMLLLSRFSRVRLCATSWTAAHQAPHSWDSPGKNTGVGCHFLLQYYNFTNSLVFILFIWYKFPQRTLSWEWIFECALSSIDIFGRTDNARIRFDPSIFYNSRIKNLMKIEASFLL